MVFDDIIIIIDVDIISFFLLPFLSSLLILYLLLSSLLLLSLFFFYYYYYTKVIITNKVKWKKFLIYAPPIWPQWQTDPWEEKNGEETIKIFIMYTDKWSDDSRTETENLTKFSKHYSVAESDECCRNF